MTNDVELTKEERSRIIKELSHELAITPEFYASCPNAWILNDYKQLKSGRSSLGERMAYYEGSFE